MVERGCGEREEGGIYLCCGLSKDGKPIEDFIIDPVIPWNSEPFRSPQLIFSYPDSGERKGFYDVLVYVGSKYYPYISDFVEECREYGGSRRIPENFPINKLTPFKSRMIFVHKRAIPKFDYIVREHKCPKMTAHEPCIGDLWDLSGAESSKNHKIEEIKGDRYEIDKLEITTPSVTYTVKKPLATLGDNYDYGLFMALPVTHVDYVNKESKVPKKLREKTANAGLDLRICRE